MKKLNILIIFAFSLLFFASCDNEQLKLNDGDLVAPTLSKFSSEQDFVVTAATNQKEVIGSIEWTEASFGVSAPVKYALVADTLESLATAVEIATYTTHSEAQDITIEMLNKAATSLTKESKEVQLYVAVKAYLGTTGAVSAIYTDKKVVSFTCYFFNPKDVLYIVGDGLVGWGNEAGNIGKDLQLFFADNSGKAELIYTYTGYFFGGKGLKFPTIAGDWDTAFGYNGTTLVANGGDNFSTPATDGLYTLQVNLATLDITMTPYTQDVTAYNSIGVIGDFNDWGTDVVMTQPVPHIWVAASVKMDAGQTFKFRANADWGVNWGGQDTASQELPFSIAKSGGDNIVVQKSANYFIAFNDITKHYIVTVVEDLPKK